MAVIVLTGMPATGKFTICKALLEHYPPRPGDSLYYTMTRDEMIKYGFKAGEHLMKMFEGTAQ